MDALPIRAGSPDTGTGQPFTARQTTASPGSVQDGFEAAYIAGGRQGRSDEGGSSTVPEEPAGFSAARGAARTIMRPPVRRKRGTPIRTTICMPDRQARRKEERNLPTPIPRKCRRHP
jgi:hypothetical protein